MANKDYEQKKRECLQEFCKLHDCETPHDYIVETFDYAFNRAYALGQQEKDADTSLWNRLTDEEKREMQCRYHINECVLSDHKKRTGDKAQSKAVARMKLLENLFGKENLKINDNE